MKINFSGVPKYLKFPKLIGKGKGEKLTLKELRDFLMEENTQWRKQLQIQNNILANLRSEYS